VMAAKGQPLGLLIAIAVAAAIGILLLLQAFLGSWPLAALLLLTLPAAVSGGVLAALAGGAGLSFATAAALLAVLALAARSGLLLAGRPGRQDHSPAESARSEVVIGVAGERFGAVVAAALATALVMLPLAVPGRIPGTELLAPLALVVLGGLVTSTLVTLFLLPALLVRFAKGACGARESWQEIDAGTEMKGGSSDATK
jgi:Cu/Ag efflux pump CusA